MKKNNGVCIKSGGNLAGMAMNGDKLFIAFFIVNT